MLARLQRAVLLGLGTAAAAWAVVFALAGSFLVAVLGAVAIVFSFAIVLGVEFALMHLINRADPVPSASSWQVLRAWWSETLLAVQVFGWRQPFCASDIPDCLPTEWSAAQPRPVVLVHGFVCNRGFWNPWMERLRRDGVPYLAVNLEPVFASIDDYIPVIEDAVQRANSATGLAPVIVAHSMGGLAVRAWSARCGGDTRARRIVTIGTPHCGTWLGYFATTLNGRQMRLDATWREGMQGTGSSHFTCFFSHCDNIVFPSSRATLPGADNRHVTGRAHVELAFQPEVFDEVLRWTGVERHRPAGLSKPLGK